MSISTEILELLAAQLKKKPEDIKPTARIKEDLGADSLDVVEILMNIEDKYKFTVPDETVMSIKTVADLTAAVDKLSKQG